MKLGNDFTFTFTDIPDKATVEVLDAVTLVDDHQLPRLVHQKCAVIHSDLV